MGLRFGRYETIQPIASGGMATVYLGRAVGAGGFERRVAIKVMHAHVAEDPEFKAMFLDEARLAARIHHPNVVSTLDVQEDAEGMFLVMEFVEGASLRDIIRALKKKKQRMPVGNAVRIIVDALSGLHAAHELRGKDGNLLQLVHRDVSPHNILVGADGITRITDFGVARAESRLSSTRGGHLIG
jgi:serine/threonine protein kinase